MPFLHRSRGAARRPARVGARATAALLALAILSACAGETPVTPIMPPEPDVPQAEPGVFPSLGTAPTSERPPPMTPEERAKLERELEGLAKGRQKELERAIDSDG